MRDADEHCQRVPDEHVRSSRLAAGLRGRARVRGAFREAGLPAHVVRWMIGARSLRHATGCPPEHDKDGLEATRHHRLTHSRRWSARLCEVWFVRREARTDLAHTGAALSRSVLRHHDRGQSWRARACAHPYGTRWGTNGCHCAACGRQPSAGPRWDAMSEDLQVVVGREAEGSANTTSRTCWKPWCAYSSSAIRADVPTRSRANSSRCGPWGCDVRGVRASRRPGISPLGRGGLSVGTTTSPCETRRPRRPGEPLGTPRCGMPGSRRRSPAVRP